MRWRRDSIIDIDIWIDKEKSGSARQVPALPEDQEIFGFDQV